MERPHLFTSGDDNKIAKIHSQNFKKSSHPELLVSQVSYVAHGPLLLFVNVFNLSLHEKFIIRKSRHIFLSKFWIVKFSDNFGKILRKFRLVPGRNTGMYYNIQGTDLTYPKCNYSNKDK